MINQQRLNVLYNHLNPTSDSLVQQQQLAANPTSATAPKKPAKRVLKIKDSLTGKEIDVPVENDAIPASALAKLDVCLLDTGYTSVAVCKSKITYIDGDKGILRYRGYDIEDLAERASFLEVAFLLINGELPTKTELQFWNSRIMKHTYLHENLIQLLKTFRYDAHPMGIIISSLSALSTFYPFANPALQGANLYDKNENIRNKQIYRILGKLPTIAACAYRHRIGKPYTNPAMHLGYTENFLYMLDRLSEADYKPNPVLARALDKLFIIHADHELNCSTAAMRHLSSSKVDPYTAMAGAAGALYGPLHGGACEAVLRMLEQIKTKENIPLFLQQVKSKDKLLMGFGHRIYKSYDPRARIVRKVAEEVFNILGKEPLIEVAAELEKIALSDPYFVERKLYPNVDFYTGIIYKAMGFPTDLFPVLFCIPRAAGWLAHWVESLDDPDTKIYRPRQVYLGENQRKFVPMDQRAPDPAVTKKKRVLDAYVSTMSKRRDVAEITN